LDLIASHGVILTDNVLWSGEVLKSPPPDTNTEAIQELNRLVHAEPGVSAVLLTIRDGVFLIKPRVSNASMQQVVPGRKSRRS
jgi:caffeoyl-CoA O-methyltransferase